MADKSYFDKFREEYERPQVDGLIVGFSGIDPQRKSSGSGSSDSCSCDNTTLTPEQKEIVRQLIREAISVIDFSECDCDSTQLSDEQCDVITQLIEQKLEELNVCECDTSNFSDEQRTLIKNIINERLEELIIHYDGGDIDDDNTEPEPQPVYEPVNEGSLDHEKLNNLLGGDTNGHFHLTQDELIKIASYPSFSSIKHENLPDLMGGNPDGHFHLDNNQLHKLVIMIDTFFPDGSDKVIITPVAPINPDNPDTPLDDYDPYGGLPSATPPGWELNMMPNGLTAWNVPSKMYYGNVLIGKDNVSEELLVPVSNNNSTTGITLRRTKKATLAGGNLVSISVSTYGDHITDYCYNSNSKNLYIATGKGSILYVFYNTVNSKIVTSRVSSTSNTYNWNSICYCNLLNKFLFASVEGKTLVTGGSIKDSGLTVNPACAAWHPTTAVFCLSGLEGTSTSFDGETWTLNSDAPHDLRDLSYHEDIDNFVAWSGEDKTFYASPDGINWTQLSDTPIPLENISTVHYEPSLQWYCAVGLGDGNAYFSKDLKHWIPTKLRNNSPVDVADVIYMPSTGLYVAMPTSGSYYYTFNPSDWN